MVLLTVRADSPPRQTTRHPRLLSFGRRTHTPHHRDGTRPFLDPHQPITAPRFAVFSVTWAEYRRGRHQQPKRLGVSRAFPGVFASATATTVTARPAVFSCTVASHRPSCGIIAVRILQTFLGMSPNRVRERHSLLSAPSIALSSNCYVTYRRSALRYRGTIRLPHRKLGYQNACRQLKTVGTVRVRDHSGVIKMDCSHSRHRHRLRPVFLR